MNMEVTKGKKSPVKVITTTILLFSAIFLVWYILADRHTPYTGQSRIKGLTIPVAPKIPGYITQIKIGLHSRVNAGDTLFEIDKRPYIIAVEQAEANVDNTAQSVAAKTASVKSAAGRLGATQAQLDGAQRNWERVQKVMKENPGALSQSDRDQAETGYTTAVEQVASAEADLERAQQALGFSGASNPQLIYAIKALEQARLDLAYTSVVATSSGYIESYSIDLGYFASSGQPIATIVSDGGTWIEADMKENNLSNMKTGDDVEFTLDVDPGRIYTGKVMSIGYGVKTGNSNPGDLPEVTGTYGWLKDPQRFPVIISCNDPALKGKLRIGGQADVTVYTDKDNHILNFLAKVRLRIISWLSYVR